MTRELQPEPLLTSLIKRNVAFIVIGGYAVAAHGYVRATKDIDICPDPARENLQRLAEALAELEAKPIGLDEFIDEFDLEPDFEGLQDGGNWTLDTKHGRLDVLQHIEGLGDDGGGWRELAPNTVVRNFLGHECLFCSYGDLIKMKRSTGRPQDEIDINSLKAARGEA